MADNSNVYFMSAVGFKPPHKGHIQMIKEAVEKAASRGSNYKLFIGQAPRDGITLDQSLQMLKIFLNGEGVSVGDGSGEVSIRPVPASSPTGKVYGDNPKNRKLGRVGKKVYTNSPLQPMINMAAEMPEGSVVVVPTSSEDADRAEKLKKILSYSRPDIEVEGLIVEPTAALEGEGKLSATDMRKAINGGDFEKFKKFIPEGSLDKAEGIWTNILGRELPVSKLTKDTLSEMIIEELKASVKNILEEGRLGQQYDMDQADAMEGEDDYEAAFKIELRRANREGYKGKEAYERAKRNLASLGITPGKSEPALGEDLEEAEMRLKDLHRKYYPEEGESATEAGGKDAVAGKPPREQGDYPDHWYSDYIHSYHKIKARMNEEETVEEISAMAGGAVEGGAGKVDEEDVLVREVYNYLMNSNVIRTKTNAD